ncbi:MAG: hypothetical protein WDO71_26435 [Bacteroidota bacterium]
MKLAYLLAQFLYTNKRLDLPGIGTFFLDPAIVIDAENSKQRSALPEGISFKNDPTIRDSPELISYISAKSGKMKALAISDLESHLELAHQFINIGKPFTFEGIGSLAKVRPGQFEFTPGTIFTEKIKDAGEKEVHGLSKKETTDAKYQAYLSTPVAKSRWRKPVIALMVLCGIGLAIWGGYTIATKNSENDVTELGETDYQTIPVDTSAINKPDSSVIQKASVPHNYKYILEIAKAKRAFQRYKQLRTNLWKVELETTDSVQYKLVLILPVSTDTMRILDSLTAMTGRKVFIEYQN